MILTREKELLPIFYILKYYIFVRELNSSDDCGIMSYQLFLMLKSFYDLHPITNNLSAKINLGVLFMDFFQLYGLTIYYDRVSIGKDGSYTLKKQQEIRFSIVDPISNNEIGHLCKISYILRQVFTHSYQIMHANLRDNKLMQKTLIFLWFGNNDGSFEMNNIL